MDPLVEHDVEIARRTSPTEKLAQALELMRTGVRLKRAALRHAAPEATARVEPRLALAAGGSGGDDGGQYLTMTPQLRQAIRLLQLSRRELMDEIRKELDAAQASDRRAAEGVDRFP